MYKHLRAPVAKVCVVTQEDLVAMEDRLHMLRRMNNQLERSESNAQLRMATAQQQVSGPGIQHL